MLSACPLSELKILSLALGSEIMAREFFAVHYKLDHSGSSLSDVVGDSFDLSERDDARRCLEFSPRGLSTD